MNTPALDQLTAPFPDAGISETDIANHTLEFRPKAEIELAALKQSKGQLLKAVQMAYRKHHLDDRSIGWDELDDYLMTALCEEMGDKEFVKWLDAVAAPIGDQP